MGGDNVNLSGTSSVEEAGWLNLAKVAEKIGPVLVDPDAVLAGAELGAKYGSMLTDAAGKFPPGASDGSAEVVMEILRRADVKLQQPEATSLEELAKQLENKGFKRVEMNDLNSAGPGGSATDQLREKGIVIENGVVKQPDLEKKKQ